MCRCATHGVKHCSHDVVWPPTRYASMVRCNGVLPCSAYRVHTLCAINVVSLQQRANLHFKSWMLCRLRLGVEKVCCASYESCRRHVLRGGSCSLEKGHASCMQYVSKPPFKRHTIKVRASPSGLCCGIAESMTNAAPMHTSHSIVRGVDPPQTEAQRVVVPARSPEACKCKRYKNRTTRYEQSC